MRPVPWTSTTAPASPKMKPCSSPRLRAAACASSPPTPTILTSFSGSQPIFLASMRAKVQVVEPTAVQPRVPPLRSSSRLIEGPTTRAKWFFSSVSAMARMVVPRSRKTSGSVAPVMPMSAEPARTPLTRSGPPLKGISSASTPFRLKNPFSMATMVGATTPKSPSTTAPILTGAIGWARPGSTAVTPAATPPATAVRKPRRVVSIERLHSEVRAGRRGPSPATSGRSHGAEVRAARRGPSPATSGRSHGRCAPSPHRHRPRR